MTPKRAMAYVGLACGLVAWLAGAGGVPAPPSAQTARLADGARRAVEADTVQAQTARMRARIAASPRPREPHRNPFVFASRAPADVPPARPVAASAASPPAAVVAGEPPIRLIGIAGHQTPDGLVRTAMITADSDELFMLRAGETLGGRYRVESVGAQGVDLIDLVTGAHRRLVLE